MTIERMLEEVRDVIARCDASEKETYEALLDEAAGWEMRLRELEAEEDDAE